MITPNQATAKLKKGIREGQTAYTDGVNAVTVNPAQQAIAKRSKWVQRMQDPEVHDRWERGLSRVSLNDWKSQTSSVGAQRFSQSSEKAGDNYQAFATEFFPFLENVQATVNAMPDITLEERIAKMVTNVREIAKFQRSS